MIINQSGPLTGTGVLFVVNRDRDSVVTVRVLVDGDGSTITYEQADTIDGSYETLRTSNSKGVFNLSPTKDIVRARVSAYVSGTVVVSVEEGSKEPVNSDMNSAAGGVLVTAFLLPIDADYTNAIIRAQAEASASSSFVEFPAGTYEYTGQLTISGAVRWLGAAGRTVLKCRAQSSGGGRIAFSGASVDLYGIIFDANGSEVSYNAWGVIFNAGQVLKINAERCAFKNAVGSLGYGAYVGGNGTTTLGQFLDGWYVFKDCEFNDNEMAGFWATASDRVHVDGGRAFGNGLSGFRIDTQDASFAKSNRRVIISEVYAWDNQAGIAVGNINRDNITSAPIWDHGFADVEDIIVSNCHCWNNTSYGIEVANDHVSLINPHCKDNGAAQILFLARDSSIIGGHVSGDTTWTIDAGGSKRCLFQGIRVRGGYYGLSIGASVEAVVDSCSFRGQTGSGIGLTRVETDGSGVAFQQLGSDCVIQGCTFYVSDTNYGVWAVDGFRRVTVKNNHFKTETGANRFVAVNRCLLLLSSEVTIQGNDFDGHHQWTLPTVGSTLIVLPDLFDEIVLEQNGMAGITSLQTYTYSLFAGKVAWVDVAHKGVGGATPWTGTKPTISFSGGGGSGAEATPYFDQEGYMIGIRITNAGSGYTSAPTVSAVGGTGGANCTMTPTVGVRLYSGKRVKFYSLYPWTLVRGGTPTFAGTTSLQIPANGILSLFVRYNTWYPDTISYGNTIQGTGSPEGVVSAPVGTVYVNLSGGASTTLYIKESGTGNTGWIAK